MAAYVYYAQSQEEQQSIMASLSGYGLIDGGELNASFQSSFDTATTEISTSSSFQSIITGFTDPPPLPGPDEIAKFASATFLQYIPDNPTVISFLPQGYETVFGVDNFSPVVTNRHLFSDTLSSDLATLSAVNSQVGRINQIYATYGYSGDTLLVLKAKQVGQDIDALKSLINDINSNPAESYHAGDYPSLSYGSPELNFVFPTTPAWGGTGGNPFQDVTPESISDQTVLSILEISGNAWINQLARTYVSPPNQFLHGNPGGSESVPLNLQSGEFITEIYGTYGEYVNCLQISTSLGQKLSYPPNPQNAPNKINWPVPAGSVLVGFQGHSGEYLDQLQPIVCTFSPATWKTTS